MPRTAIIAGKITAIVIVTLIQAIVLAITAGILGFRASFAEILLTLVVLLLSTASFTAFGLLLGGTLAAEKSLAWATFCGWFY